MSTIHSRINEVVNSSSLTKTAFAKKINISQSMVSLLCAGRADPSDRTISDICREFGCNEVWLRTGEGEPFRPISRDEAIMQFAVDSIRGSSEFRKAFVATLAKLEPSDWETLGALFSRLAEEVNSKE